MQGACQRAECDWGDYWFVGKALIVNVVKRAFAHRLTWAARTIYHPAGFWRQDSNLGICWVLQMCLQPSQAPGLSCLQTGPLLKKSRKTTILLFVIKFESYCPCLVSSPTHLLRKKRITCPAPRFGHMYECLLDLFFQSVDKGSCTYYVITDRGGGLSKWLQYYIGVGQQMVTVLHRGALAKWLQYK